MTTARECAWTAQPEIGWLSIKSGTSGQGSGTVDFAVLPNPDPVARRGAIVLNGQRAEITQGAAPCVFTLGAASAEFAEHGGTGRVEVGASSALCAWSAASDADWLTVASDGTGRGTAPLDYVVAANPGPARTGTLTVAGHTFTVSQAAAGAPPAPGPVPPPGPTPPPAPPPPTPACTFAVSPTSLTFPASGGSAPVSVTSPPGCAWTASSGASWLSIQGAASGAGSGTVVVVAAATSGPSRSGALTVAGQAVTVNQGQGCTFTLEPTSVTVPAAGAYPEFRVRTAAGCAWTASESSHWLSISSGSSGSGEGIVKFAANPNTGPARTATITAAGQIFTVNQPEGCAFTLSAESLQAGASGGAASVGVMAGGGCAWTASSHAPWITITSGAAGSGNGTVAFAVAANDGALRSGTMTIAGQTFTVAQAEGCSFVIAPETHAADAAGGSVRVGVTAPAACAWTATSEAPWLTFTSPPSGSGEGSVDVAIAANPGAARSGTATIAGRTFTVTQAASCSFSIAPEAHAAEAAGGSVRVTIGAPDGCAWTATAGASWLTFTSAAEGVGPGAVDVAIAANTGAARTATATIAGLAFTVTQAGGCSFAVSPGTIVAASGGGPARVEITAEAGCAWTASSGVDWVTISAGAEGAGSGAVDLAIAVNTGPARSGTVTVAGHSLPVTQESGCTATLGATSQVVPPGGGTGTVAVTTPAGCDWTAASQVEWITITSGAAGSGDGAVQFSVAPNTTGAPRAGAIAIAGQTFTVNQE